MGWLDIEPLQFDEHTLIPLGLSAPLQLVHLMQALGRDSIQLADHLEALAR